MLLERSANCLKKSSFEALAKGDLADRVTDCQGSSLRSSFLHLRFWEVSVRKAIGHCLTQQSTTLVKV